MSMHLVGPYMTTTKYNRKTKKSKSKRLAAAEAEHEKFLAKMGVGKTKAQHSNELPDYRADSRALPTSDRIDGYAPVKERNVYSGERQLLGIATMHKSNMVPVFADKAEDAKDIAAMRRN